MRKFLLIPILLSGCGVAVLAPAALAAPATEAPAGLEKVNVGELRLDGRVTALLGDGLWQLDAVAWTSPRGVTTNFDDVKVKAIQLTPDAVIHRRGSSIKLTLKDVPLKTTIAVIGKNGADGTLMAREVIVIQGDTDHETVGSLSTNRETGRLIDESRKVRALGQLPKSLELAQRAAETAAGLRDFSGEALATQDVALVLSQLDRNAEALAAFQHEQALGERIGNSLAQVLALDGQSDILVASGKTDEAITALERASGLLAGVPPTLRTGVLSDLGRAYRIAGKRNEAVGAYGRLLPMQEGDDALSTLLTLAALQAPADPASAKDYLDQARQRMDTIRDESRKPNIIVLFARALRATGDSQAAAEQFEAAAALLDAKGDAAGAARIRAQAKAGGDDNDTDGANGAPATPAAPGGGDNGGAPQNN